MADHEMVNHAKKIVQTIALQRGYISDELRERARHDSELAGVLEGNQWLRDSFNGAISA